MDCQASQQQIQIVELHPSSSGNQQQKEATNCSEKIDEEIMSPCQENQSTSSSESHASEIFERCVKNEMRIGKCIRRRNDGSIR